MMAPGRFSCVVPFCRRTRGRRKGEDPIREGQEWICGDHWRAVCRRLKRMKRAAKRAWNRANERCDAIGDEGYAFAKANGGGIHQSILERFSAAADECDKKRRQCGRIWERCKREAIEAAGGIR